jgi:hypothetical protein
LILTGFDRFSGRAHSFSIYAEAVIKTRINGIANPHKRKREYVATENKNALRRKTKMHCDGISVPST